MSQLDDVLEHFGIKGMKWGVRRSDAELAAPSSDFVKSREKKSVAKTSGTKALSNEELQLVITRMNLERQFSSLNPTPGKAATKFVSDLLLNVGKQQATRAANDFASKQIAAAMAKGNE